MNGEMGISIQMIFSPQSCSEELLNKTLTPKRRKIVDRILAQIEKGMLTHTSHHNLIIGPRGSGKTHMLTYIRKVLKTRYANNNQLSIISVSEQEQGIRGIVDLFLACFNDLNVSSQEVLSLIGGVVDKAARKDTAIELFNELTGDKPTLIVIENLASIFKTLEEPAIAQLRSFLQENSLISLLATSQTLFTKSNMSDHPFYGFFNIHPLQDLDRNGAKGYLLSLAQAKGDRALADALLDTQAQSSVDAIYDLTGGNHRLLAMLSSFLTEEVISQLAVPFVKMADQQLTPYYQQQLASLSPQQNKLLRVIACHHGRALSVNEIARFTLLTPSTVSRQLYELLQSEYVVRSRVGRESFYELKEPLLRLVLQIRQGHVSPLPLTINLLKKWHEEKEYQAFEKEAPGHANGYYQIVINAKEGTEDEVLGSLPEMLHRLSAHQRLRTLAAYRLIDRFISKEDKIGQVVSIYKNEDKDSLVCGLILWIKRSITSPKREPGGLGHAYETLRRLFSEMEEASFALQILEAACRYLRGDPNALFALPLELRRLVERALN